METFNGLLIGTLFTLVTGIFIYMNSTSISDNDFYRFCMVKEIKLEDCKIPKHPYKGENE